MIRQLPPTDGSNSWGVIEEGKERDVLIINSANVSFRTSSDSDVSGET